MLRKVFALFLGFVLFLSVTPSVFAKEALDLFDFPGMITASSEGSRTVIHLQWEPVAAADGVQIFRSDTGKRNSYSKICTVRGTSSFQDSGRKANHIYYYKLRPFKKTEDGFVFGDFEYVSAATALTESFVKKQLSKAFKVAYLFFDASMPRCKNGRNVVRRVVTDEGLMPRRFFEVNSDSIRSVAELKAYLKQFFSSDLTDSIVNHYYCDYKGKLYQLEADAAESSYILIDQISLKKIRQNNTAVTFQAVLRRPDLNQEKNTFASFLGVPKQKQRKSRSTGRIIVNMTDNDWNLTLVNKQRELPRGFAPQTSQIMDTGYYLDYRVTPYYEKMYRAAKRDGCYLSPYSAYRSYQYQNMLFRNYASGLRSSGYSFADAEQETARQILYPGTSEHQLGLAIDVKGTGQWFSQTKEYQWLKQHAHAFGFIERYTNKKKLITGIIPEPWHWRFVGKPWATEIRNSGLCLEEYLALKGGLYLTEKRNYYMVAENGRWVFACDENGDSMWPYGNYAYRKTPAF